jgi:hypothetical protein
MKRGLDLHSNNEDEDPGDSRSRVSCARRSAPQRATSWACEGDPKPRLRSANKNGGAKTPAKTAGLKSGFIDGFHALGDAEDECRQKGLGWRRRAKTGA